MRAKSIKNLSTVLGILLLAAVFTSCNRGGVGCPYELEAATNVLMNIIK
ncbi:MAG: hypothetical protein P1U56_12515 [Saprospiraceae bacterium]|nr:hypothetical protein [Saprospiraceae bacterium]